MQSQGALDNQERHLEGRAVKLIVIAQKFVVLAENVADRLQGNVALIELVPRYAVVVEDSDSHRGEDRAYGEGPNRMRNLGHAEAKRPQ